MLLQVRDLGIAYGKGDPVVRHVSFDLDAGQVLAIVGESGSGKTTVIRAIQHVLPGGGHIAEGQVILNGEDTQKQTAEMHGLTDEKEAHDRMISMLEMVRLPDPEQVLKSYTYELSGGMRQRVGIAMAMSFHPKLLLADEPTSALDVTTQATIVKEMMEVRKNMNIAIIIVTHNMGVAAYMADNIMVMKNGEVVEYGKAEEVIYHPKTDYVKMLLAAVPSLGGKTTA